MMEPIIFTVSTGYLPAAVSPESITASVPSMIALATSPASASFGGITAGEYSTLETGDLDPGESNTYALGSTSLYWSDLFLGSGAVINMNDDVTLTHSLNLLAILIDILSTILS